MRNRDVYYHHFHVSTNALSVTFQEMQGGCIEVSLFLCSEVSLGPCPLKENALPKEVYSHRSLTLSPSTAHKQPLQDYLITGFRKRINKSVSDTTLGAGCVLFYLSRITKSSLAGNRAGVSHSSGRAEGHGIGALGCHSRWLSMELEILKPEAMKSERTALGKAQC